MPDQVRMGLGLGPGLLFPGSSCLLSPTSAPSFTTEHVATTVWPSEIDLGLSPCSGVSLPDCKGLGAPGRLKPQFPPL